VISLGYCLSLNLKGHSALNPNFLIILEIIILLLLRSDYIATKHYLCMVKSFRSMGVPQNEWTRSLSLAF